MPQGETFWNPYHWVRVSNDPVQHARCNVAALKFQQDEQNYEFAANQVGLGPHQNLLQRALGLSTLLPVVGWAGRAVGWLGRGVKALLSWPD